jgi:hypothetical protein|tara:strand:+ start:1444 stop:1605 length:162 start_codon:yes stop_codon:yes gene_type:complete
MEEFKKVVVKKIITGYEITKPNGKVISRDASEWDDGAKARYESKGCKVKEIKK